jgi:hypothetical protein
VFIDHCTIVTKTNGVAASWKSNATGPGIDIHVTNSIVVAEPAILSNFGTTNVLVGYSILSTEWAGQEVSLAPPGFASMQAHDYRLSNRSPAIDLGELTAAADPDGTRSDAGYIPFQRSVALATLRRETLSLDLTDVPDGRTVVTEASTDLKNWTSVGIGNVAGVPYARDWLLDPNKPITFFRFRIE